MPQDSIQNKTEMIINTLDDVATLIGEFRAAPVLLSNGVSIVPGLGMTTDEVALQRRVTDIRLGLFTIMVVGKFKNGKSTLINALLGKELVRTRPVPTTAVITVIVHGTNSDVALFEFGKANPKFVSWQTFQNEYRLKNEDENAINEDRFGNIDYAQIETEHAFVTRGIKLVDSPGLDEDSARSKTTLRFIKLAQAVIFVLDATRLLDEKERSFIREQFGDGRLDHVFFVINRINNVDESDGMQEIRERTRKILSHHFVNSRGLFDENFYNKRIFFVNAHAAFYARRNKEQDNLSYENSGVAALEKEIEQILNTDDRFRAVAGSSVQALIGILADAHNQIERRKIAIRQPLLSLQERYQSLEKRLKQIESLPYDIGKEIRTSGKKLNEKIAKSFRDHIILMEQKWKDQSKELMPMSEIQLSDLLKCAISDDTKKKVVKVIQSDVNRYVNYFVDSWSDKIMQELETAIEKLEQQTSSAVQTSLKQLNQIHDEFAFGSTRAEMNVDNDFSFRPSNSILSSMGSGSDDWNSVISASIMELLVSLGVWIWALFNPLILMAAIASSLLGLSFANPMQILENFKAKIRNRIGMDIHSRVKEDDRISNLLYQNVNHHFQSISDDVCGQLQRRIQDTKVQMLSVLDELQQGSTFSIEEENKRLDIIHKQLERLFNLIGVPVLGRQYRLKELGQITTKRGSVE